ncbi:uncharacterized protein LOC130747367 isoform X2 [Lotus japonicus]|uniref:uncharacterized protein LOC130747367 isoform X2 n=1 Tax=Lotus japonicus TaxID=34305 RepID=UPI002587B851|nr:uncharacterized protein LOC130747367 isoform X2 [Lotus japonicus]
MYQGALKRDKFTRRSSRILAGKIKAGAPSAKKDFASSIKPATEVPHSSFQFHVCSDEGINLHVDLNLSPSDWTNRFRKEVRISENLRGNKPWSLWQDLHGLEENSKRGNFSLLSNTSSGQIDNCDEQVKSSSSMKLIKDNVAELDQQNRGAANTTFNKSLCDSVGNSLSEPGTLELQNSKPDNEYYEDCALPNSSFIVNPGVSCAGASLSNSGEIQNSEVASCNKYTLVSLCDNDGSLELCYPKNTSDAEQGGLVNSSETNFIIDGNDFPSLIEEWEVGKTVDGRESSACSQFDDPLMKSCLESTDQDSKMELRRKRKNRDSEIQDSSDTPATRILRSMKNTAVMVLRRRSTRLISK